MHTHLKISFIFTFIVLFTSTTTAPLKAMLYCQLPTVDTNRLPQLQKLTILINNLLKQKRINVQVDICDPQGNGKYLYDPSKIDLLFNDYDIIQIDTQLLYAIKTPLMHFKKAEIDYYDDVYPFEWTSVMKYTDSRLEYVGSPGIICSDFKISRRGDYQKRLYASFRLKYLMMSLYTNIYLNQGLSRTLDNMDFSKIQYISLIQLTDYLKQCQSNTTKFDYDSNWCMKPLTTDFSNTNYTTTVGYSQTIFKLIASGKTKEQNLQIAYMLQTNLKRMIYVDHFVAKQQTQQSNRQTILNFYKFMISDQVLQLYIRGKYTNLPGLLTYLIPPTKTYFNRMKKQNRIYQNIYNILFKTEIILLPLYQQRYQDNLQNLVSMLQQQLKQFGKGHMLSNK